MTVKIVTDSVSDLPKEIVKSLGITVIPMVVKFGDEYYLEGIDLSEEQFYNKLVTSEIFPVTSVPPPEVFIQAYNKLAQETDEILVISVSSKLAAAYNVAQQAVSLAKSKCKIEVIDSNWAAMAQGMIVIAVAEAAKKGASLEELKQIAHVTMARVDLHATFDTLEYLRRGGRIGHARAFVGSVLKTNPIVTLRNGIVEPVTQARSRAKAVDLLVEFVKSFSEVEKIAVEDAACSEEAEILVKQLSSLFPKVPVYRSRVTPSLGVHTGPGLLVVAVQGTGHRRS